MRSLPVIIAIVLFIQMNAHAQMYTTSPQLTPTLKNTEQSNVNSIADSLKMIKEKEWNKHLIINSDSRVDSLIQIHCEENERKNGIDGYRVQIFQGTREEANQVKARFMTLHEDIKAYSGFKSPDFKVRVGDFRTKSEAIKLKHLIKDEFAASYIVEDVINFPELFVTGAGN